LLFSDAIRTVTFTMWRPSVRPSQVYIICVIYLVFLYLK